jgi:hypothetical protein
MSHSTDGERAVKPAEAKQQKLLSKPVDEIRQ